jgi:hypothetical protein
LVEDVTANSGTNHSCHRSGPTKTRRNVSGLTNMPRRTRLFPVHPRIPPGVSRWRAKPRWDEKPRLRGATDDGDDGWLEEWMVGYPSIARTLN